MGNDVVDIYPLTPLQEGLLFHTLLEPESGVYVVQTHGLLKGPLDLDDLSDSWDEVVERRSVLRSSFEWEELDRPLQIVHRSVQLPLMKKDWTNVRPEDREARWEQLLRDDRRQGFDLAQAPLMRFVVVRVGPERHRFLWSHHHILLDGWSLPLLLKEVFSIYEARRRGTKLELPAAPPFRAYVDWIEGQDQEQAQAFWRTKLAGFEEPVRLGIDSGVEPEEASYGEETVTLSPAQSKELEAFCRERQLTLNTLVQGAWAVVMARYSGRRDLVFGVVVSGRSAPLPGIESIVGPLINTLPNRVVVNDRMEVGEWLADQQRESAELRRNESSPLVKIQAQSEVEPGTPLFDYVYVFENYPLDTSVASGAGLSFEVAELAGIEQANYPLGLLALPRGDRLGLRVLYCRQRFPTWSVLQLLGHVKQVLAAFLEGPEQPLGAIDLLSEAERRELLVDWNDNATAYPSERSVHELFEEQVTRSPESIAVVFGETELSYAELNARANQLAHALRARGMGPESLVALCVERSADMVVAMLGILKTGAAYVPLDPDYPTERLAFMLQDSGATLVLTKRDLADRVPGVDAGGCAVLCLDAEPSPLQGQSRENPTLLTDPESLAYVIYTSGSTGRPKGVALHHRGLCHLAAAQTAAFPVEATDRVLQFASLSFDASVSEVFTTLLKGATLCLGTKADMMPGTPLVDFCRRHQPTVVTLPPTALNVLPEAELGMLRTIVSAGEACTPELVSRWAPGRRFLNAYGPSEITVCATMKECDPGDGQVTIGRPIPNARVYVLDERMEPPPVGVPGELYLGGAGLARGYLHQAGLTAERFVPDPFGEAPGARLYRTGDLARWLPDGDLAFLGRMDHQVKLRGFRVELGEIEATLCEHPAVDRAVVVARDDSTDHRRLVAYGVPRPGVPAGGEEEIEFWPSTGEFLVYDDLLYLAMVRDELRNESYRAAIRKHCQGKTIVEVGPGPEAILARFCIEAGARKVFAIELLEETYRKAQAYVRAAGLEDRIVLIHGDATQVELPEKVDVCVSEIVGAIGSMEGAVPILNSARRFLKEDGVMIPVRSVTKIAAVSLPEELLELPGFSRTPAHYVQRIFDEVGHAFDLRLCVKNFPRDNVLTTVGDFEDLDFSGHVPPEYTNDVTLEFAQDGRFDGLLLWLRLHTSDDSVIDILENRHCWLPVYFPIFHPGQVVSRGDRISLSCRTVMNGRTPDYAVEGTLHRAQGADIDFQYSSRSIEPGFRQNPFHRFLFSEDCIVPRRFTRTELTSALRDWSLAHLPDYMVPARFVLLDSLPLTPSGKLDRKALPAPDGVRPELAGAYVAPSTETEKLLAGILEEVLSVDRVGIHDNFFALGGDSILGIQVVSRVRVAGFQCTPLELFQNQTVAALATVVREAPGVEAEQGEVIGPVELTPIQHWFLDGEPVAPQHFNQSLLFEVRGDINTGHLAAALEHLVAHHDALRLQFSRTGCRWQQVNAPVTEQSCLTCHDLTNAGEGEQAAAIERICVETQAGFDLSSGLLMRAVFFDLGRDRPGRLLLVVHHLAVDGVSWRILLEDLLAAFRQASAGKAVSLPPKTHSFQEWASRLREYAGSEELAEQRGYWCELLESAGDAGFPLDRSEGENRLADVRQVVRVLDEQRTASLLREVPPVYHTRINDVLLAALIEAYHTWSGGEQLLVDLEGHGREELFPGIDVSRTVGWFTSLYPVLLEKAGAAGPGELLKSVKEQLRGVPQQGLGYGPLRYLGPEEIREALRCGPQALVSFNYLGQLDRGLAEQSELFAPASESKGSDRAAEAKRTHAVDISGYVAAGRLRLAWQYSEELSDGASIEAFADAYVAALEQLIAHCLEPEAGGYTPSDFPLAQIAAPGLDQLAAQVGPIEDLYPLSPTQEGLLFHTLLEPESGVYMVQQHGLLVGELDMAALSSAWQQTTQRHALLRTSFVWEGLDRPLQVVHPQVPIPMITEDWTGLSTEKQERRWKAWLADDLRRGFALQQAPLMRFAVARVGAEAHRFLWSQHHLLSDGWSLPLLLTEVFALYEAHRNGTTLDLPSHPFRNYIAWLEQRDPQQAESFWRDRLAGFEEPIRLDIDRGGSVPTPVFGEESRELSAERMHQLEDFARANQLTVNTVVEAAWALVLGRYSRRDDVVFGETVSGRSAPLAGIESIIGPMINTLPTRVDLSGTVSVREWLQRLQQQAAELRHYEHTPLMKIQSWSGVGAGTPLFEYLYVFENYPLGEIEQAAVAQSIQLRELSAQEPTHYPLTLLVAPTPRLTLRLTYPEHRFAAWSVQQLLAHIEQVLGEFLRNPEIPLHEVSVLTAADRDQLLATRNQTIATYPSDRCIHELFEVQAERTPDAPAVVSGDEVLSYRELDRRSNQVAHFLREVGVGPESLVGICVERSPEMIVGLVGILKAGGAYVPLDPGYPSKRLAFMVQESRAEVLLTRHALLDRLPQHGARVVCLDTDRSLLTRQSTERPHPLTTPEHPAYVIFTSGSTGRPKGVCLPHQVLTNLISWQLERTQLDPGAVTLQYSAASFDVSLQEIFTALCSGSELVLLPHSQARDIEAVARCIEARGVQRLFMPFVALAQLADTVSDGTNGAFPLREVITAGEQLQCTPGIRRLFERLDCRLDNQYGPSETHVVTAFALSDTPRDWVGLPPIGGPIANTHVYVVDEQFRPVPVGVAGELYLGGIGLARGYVHRGDLTAERFVPNPFADAPGERLYRTGDLVRWQPDWNLEFLGRIDQQVKIRGFRIELGEIEAVLSQHELVRESVVLAQEEQTGRKRLVAYLVPHAEAPTIESLRDHLKESVPDYMVPQAFVTLDTLPLTPSGKVDRKALPAPEGTRPELASGFVAPRDPTEETLAEIWGSVLGVDGVGVHDSFFALGGDSILGLQVLSRIRAEGLSCTPSQLFQNQTIAELAQVVTPAVTVFAEQGEITGPVGLTPIQHWYLDPSPVAPHHFNQSLLLELRQRMDPEELDAALRHLVTHHDALRMRFSEREGEWQQLNEPVQEVACLSRVDLSGLSSEAQVASIETCCAETQAGIDLDSGLLLRAVYFDLGAERSGRLLLVIHHLVVDGVSWRVLLADLYLAYQALIRGQPIVLPPKTTSFKEWSRRLEEYTGSEQLASEASYWLSLHKLAGEIAFPLDNPQGENKIADSRQVVRTLDEEQTEALLRKVPPVYHTQINDVLLAALVDAFQKWSDQDRLLLELEGHGREELLEEVDVSRTVGWFTILYPVVLRAPEEGGIGELLKSVKEQLRGIPRKGIGYGVLRYLDESEVGKELREGPRAKLSFNYLGQLERGLAEQSELFASAPESQGSGRSPEQTCHYAVDVTGFVVGDRLQMTWRYGENLHTRETMERFADAYMESLQRIIGHCLDPQSGGFTPSDFELAGLDQERLDSLVQQVSRRKSK